MDEFQDSHLPEDSIHDLAHDLVKALLYVLKSYFSLFVFHHRVQ